MAQAPLFQEDLINRYDKPGPRYTSYPPATEFHDQISESDYRDWASSSNEEPIPKPLSLYFHIPFCSSICYYCACNKVITKRKERAEPYLQDLYREIEIQASLFDPDREVRQLHWGGGTPGFLSHQQSQQLMENIAKHFRLQSDGDTDYSIELDPRVIARDGISHLRGLGFNRISIGVQDLDEKVQKAVNRLQSLEITSRVIDDARRHGIRSINIDLIYGLPHQTLESFAVTLDRIIDLNPDRIAMYNYAHLPHRFPPQRRIQVEDLPDAAEKLAILHSAIDKLCTAGYEYIGRTSLRWRSAAAVCIEISRDILPTRSVIRSVSVCLPSVTSVTTSVRTPPASTPIMTALINSSFRWCGDTKATKMTCCAARLSRAWSAIFISICSVFRRAGESTLATTSQMN
jgi:oxygen-independent coproporphyrinogen-3 oxidase